ncbi:MAG TPA: zinc ribbon domain-containing protein [Candidatus Limnocylindria bacterium]|nr:zinc ribbon domain-containing protein [Candidatus Limnocylindria bacterium]
MPPLLDGMALAEVELIEPLPVEFQNASPHITHPEEARLWLDMHGQRSPIARHALYVLESVDAIDLAYETFAVTLLHGHVDTSGFPRFDAVVGGLTSYWDESTGELIVRAALAWGGEGVRGDTDRISRRLVARMMSSLLASQGAAELGPSERPVAHAAGRRAACPHCGFASIDARAIFCPKCGMRLSG